MRFNDLSPIIKVNNLETNKVLAGPMGQFHAIKKVGGAWNHAHMLKTRNPMVEITINSKLIFIQTYITIYLLYY
jgi:hypothetical protein